MNIILFDTFPDANLIPADDYRAQHIISILKLKAGDSFRMGIVNHSEGIAEIESIDNGNVHFNYVECTKPVLNPVTMIIAQVRPICMKRILREAVSLGCGRIILTGSDTGEKSYLSSNLYKSGEYMEYALDGAMQSAHAGVPSVEFAQNVKEAVELAGTGGDRILLDNVIGAENLSKAQVGKSAILAIGPERGWSDREKSVFVGNGYRPMLLGQRVLRTETACSCGLAVLLTRMGLM